MGFTVAQVGLVVGRYDGFSEGYFDESVIEELLGFWDGILTKGQEEGTFIDVAVENIGLVER